MSLRAALADWIVGAPQPTGGKGAPDSLVVDVVQPHADALSVALHELKTPINVMLGYIRLLLEGVYGPLSERQTDVCHVLEHQCQSIARLSNQLLDLHRFGAGAAQLDLRRFALSPFLDELQASFHVLALEHGVELVVSRAAPLPVDVVWDRDGINEVLSNLLMNALRFTPRGGRVELDAHADTREVCFYVRDTGAGIPAEQLRHIFDKFYRADNQHATTGKGIGLGLAIAKALVAAHGGTIGVESTMGAGTLFSIVLPITPPGTTARYQGERPS